MTIRESWFIYDGYSSYTYENIQTMILVKFRFRFRVSSIDLPLLIFFRSIVKIIKNRLLRSKLNNAAKLNIASDDSPYVWMRIIHESRFTNHCMKEWWDVYCIYVNRESHVKKRVFIVGLVKSRRPSTLLCIKIEKNCRWSNVSLERD